MNRSIKFRGQRIDTKEWVYGDYGRLVLGGNTHYYITALDCKCVEVIPETVGQFTGLLDKNVNEIYEGDWLHIAAGYTSKVEFQDGMFVSVYSHPEDGETLPLIDVISDKTIVIGNIHE